jgi:hypothetical protein
MPGPNSAPNGDAGLVRGNPQERFIFCDPCQKKREAQARENGDDIPAPRRYPARSHAAKHGRLFTGKTQLDKARKGR